METVDPVHWCERVRTCFTLFAEQPHTLQHLLLFGPPGSGKTTSAAWLVDQLWGSRKALMCISLNAADERSLESIRQKVFPFLTVDWREPEERAPRFLILDECETLTEAAQLSLQTLLQARPTELCVILICNSQSRIHPKLRQRLLKLRYDPPPRPSEGGNAPLFAEATRGDLRARAHQQATEERFWRYLHAHPTEYRALLRDPEPLTVLTELLLLADHFHVLDAEWLDAAHALYPYLLEPTLTAEAETQLIQLLGELKDKIDKTR